jgi:hypothetical protein
MTAHDRLPQHAADHRTAAPAAAWAGADARAFTYLLECPGACLDRFRDRAFADFVTQTSRLEIFDNRPLSGFLF